MNHKPVIGILGGMGPAAGFDLANKITRVTRAAGDHDHLPVILMSLPREIPDRTPFLLRGDGVNPGDAISAIAIRLENAGATVVGIPCNTAHAPPIMQRIMTELAEADARIRLVNMIEETITHLRRTIEPGTRVGILSTSGVRKTRLYSRPLNEAGFDVVELDDDVHRSLIMDALYSGEYGLKAISPPTDRARTQVEEALTRLETLGAGVAILGCTELPLAVPEREWGRLSVVDPTELLARALIRETYPERLIMDES